MYRLLVSDYLRWYRRDFHPRQQDDRPLIEAHLARMAS
jgi:predicted metal-dependent hydrolase